MAKRVQSPSSINTYKQCPRKYYFIYIKKLSTLPSIHLIRGSVVHSVLEDFYKIDPRKLPENGTEILLWGLLSDFLKTKWVTAMPELEQLEMTEAQQLFYYEETEQMLHNWFRALLKKLAKENSKFSDAFLKWIPKTEEEYISEKHGVKGYIDAIHEIENEIILMDYKTSNKDFITPEYRLQLAIYALLYHEKHGKLPKHVGINFLKFGERLIDVDDSLIKLATLEAELIHTNTLSDEIIDYPKKPSPLCKYSSGKCDFYDYCYDKNGRLKEGI